MEEGMNVFSIKDLENFSGIKAHTIRIWEKRYNILEPGRTDSNIRTYNESELKKIMNVAYLNRNGLKISKIARLDDDELTQKVMSLSSSNDDPEQDYQPGKILMSAIRFNEELFMESLLPFIRLKGIEEAYCRYYHPLLEKARILWQTGSLSRAQEQFIRNTLKHLIIIEENRLKTSENLKGPVVAMINTSGNLTENNFHFYKYVLRTRGFDVIYPGGILPATELIEIYKVKPFDYLVVNSGSFDFSDKKTDYFSKLGKSLMVKKIIFTDAPGDTDGFNNKLIFTRDPAEFIKAIESLL